uniref:Uncharacterized protein n=1 Tax=Dulem virus 36 TaxID=3145754 RepID=A0AAU8AYJ8_9CAUD
MRNKKGNKKMQIKLEMNLEMRVLYKGGYESSIQRNIVEEFDENSEEYKETCAVYENLIGFSREQNPNEFDKKLLEFLSRDARAELQSTIDKITSVVKKAFLNDVSGIIEFAGGIFRLSEISEVRFGTISVRFTKK